MDKYFSCKILNQNGVQEILYPVDSFSLFSSFFPSNMLNQNVFQDILSQFGSFYFFAFCQNKNIISSKCVSQEILSIWVVIGGSPPPSPFFSNQNVQNSDLVRHNADKHSCLLMDMKSSAVVRHKVVHFIWMKSVSPVFKTQIRGLKWKWCWFAQTKIEEAKFNPLTFYQLFMEALFCI